MVQHIQQFFETLLGVALPTWIYNAFGLLISLAFLLSLLQLAFPKMSKYVRVTVLAITLGYIAYEVLPVWGVAIQGG